MSRRIMAITWTLLIIVACAWPLERLPIDERGEAARAFKHLDKVVHAALFLGYGVAWSWAGGRKTSWIAIALTGVALGVGTEQLQNLPIVNRDAGLDDFLADVVGLALGMGLGYAWFAGGQDRLRLGRGGRTPDPLELASMADPAAPAQ